MRETTDLKPKTAWYNKNMPENMMNTHFPHIVNSDHFSAIKECFNYIDESENIIDLGCGKAEISDAFPKYKYCGADLPHIIHNVSKLSRPTLEYKEFDAHLSDMDFVSDFDIIVMNSFLSEISNANQILDKVLTHAKKYVIVHRQAIENQENIATYSTYGGLQTIVYTFDRKDFENIVYQNNFKKIIEVDASSLKTILLKRT